jgi:hypothetical protein
MHAVPWGLEAPERRALLKELCFSFHKWDLHASGHEGVLPETLVLDGATHRRVVAIAERFSQILAGLEDRVARDPVLLGRLGIPAELHPILRAAPPQELQLARYDLHPTPDGGLMVSEFNEDVPGGFNEAVGLPALLGERFGRARFTGDLRGAVKRAMAPYGPVGAMFATGYSEDLQHSLLIEDWLREAGHPTVRGSPAQLTRRWGRTLLDGQRIEAAFRYYPGEWFPRLPNFDLWLRLGDRLPMLNPLRRLIRQSKLLFAVWREPGLLSADDLAFVDAHAPWTGVPGRDVPLAQLHDEPTRWVLKRAFGRMGDAVVIGALVEPKAWVEALRDVTAEPAAWLAQRRFEHVPMRFDAGPLYPAIGPYLVNGRFAGYYSRAAPKPLLTHEALHVATVVVDP